MKINKKKILMIIVLIVFISGIGAVFAVINNNSTEKISNESNATENKATNEMVVITDNFFIQQTDDIYLNIDEYIGKTIKIEGLIYPYADEKENLYYAVIRNTPGCCGNDGISGIDIRYDGDYPEANTWVEVIGTIETDIIDGDEVPAVKVSTMQEKEAGLTFVTN